MSKDKNKPAGHAHAAEDDEHDDKKPAKAAKGDGKVEAFNAKIDAIAAGHRKLVDAGMGSSSAADVAAKAWDSCCEK